MKKIILIICLMFGIFVTGCNDKKIENNNESKPKQTNIVCNGENNLSDNIKISTKYEIEAEEDKVSNLTSTETINSDNLEYLETTKNTFEQSNSVYKDIAGYDSNIEINENKLISTLKIDYNIIDLNKLIEIDSANKNLIVDNYVSLNKLKSMYESLGTKCQEIK